MIDTDALTRALTQAAEEQGFVSERAHELIDAIVDEMASDPRNAGDEDDEPGEVRTWEVVIAETIHYFTTWEGRSAQEVTDAVTLAMQESDWEDPRHSDVQGQYVLDVTPKEV